jgi:multidrug efflux pump subunit AcrA (membrane-fusion protein)
VTAEPVAWDLAEKVAVRVAGRDPFASSYHYASLQPDFDELTAEAEELVAAETGLRSLAGPARARVTDRAGWVHANVASFRRLLRPITDRIGPTMAASPIAPVGRAVAGAELGALLGWMSTRVLGQYDLLLVEDEDPEDQDIVYFVAAKFVYLGLQIDPGTRTALIAFEVPNTNSRLRIGQTVQLAVGTRTSTDSVAIPESAIVEEEGRPVAFVQVSGETFEKRDLTLGVRGVGFVQVLDGLKEGERVVSKGAFAIRLASVSNVIPAHGHAH